MLDLVFKKYLINWLKGFSLKVGFFQLYYTDVPIYLHLRTWLFKLHLYFQANRIIYAIITVKSVHNKILNSYIYFWFNFSQ